MEPSDRYRWTSFFTSCTLDQSVDHLCYQGSHLSHCRQLPQPPSPIHRGVYRAYIAVQQWIGNNVCPNDWGWQYMDGSLVPFTTDRPIAPTRGLRIVFCGCKTGFRKTCRHRKARLYCTAMCSHCNGQTSSNIHALAVSQYSDDDS